MALKIVLNKRADSKLNKTLEYIKIEWSARVANEFLENLYNTIEIISVFPEIGTLVDSKRNIIGFLVTKQLRMYYRVENDKLIILNFIDTRQKPKND